MRLLVQGGRQIIWEQGARSREQEKEKRLLLASRSMLPLWRFHSGQMAIANILSIMIVFHG